MLKIKLNNDKIFEYREDRGGLFINNSGFEVDVLRLSENKFHLIKDNRSFNAEVIDFDSPTKTFRLKVNGKIIEAQVKDQLDMVIEKMGISVQAGLKISEVKAPMPGLILDVKVKEGQEVNQGDNLIILEAMKMENSIKSPRQGTIKTVKVKQGESVEKNQILLEFSN